MSGSKRSCPFGFTEGGGGSPGHAKALKEDTGSIYAATLNKLKLGARAATTGRGSQADLCSSLERLAIYSLPATTPQLAASSPPCHVCKCPPSSDKVCFHCSRNCCEQCCIRCEGCEELFCSVCSTSNYSERYERSFCFDCNAETPTRTGNRSYNYSGSLFRSPSNDEARSMELSCDS
ncbi:unnamed protein product [Calypogeia fissa]